MKKQIVKIQIPLSYNHDEPMALIYNKSRSVETLMPIDEALMTAMDGDFKAFFEAILPEKRGHVRLLKRVKDPGW